MPYSIALERKIETLTGPGFEKKKMFGGIGYLFKGNMGFGIYRDSLVLRLGEENAERVRLEKTTRPFDITGRPMKGWLMIEEAGWRDNDKLAAWLSLARTHALSLPAK
jgi:TfoX/Sxy family transcriptional regulator of competence genes